MRQVGVQVSVPKIMFFCVRGVTPIICWSGYSE